MAMTDAEPLFIDINTLIYANVVTAPFHEQAFNAIKAARQSDRPLWISRHSALTGFSSMYRYTSSR